MQSIIVKELIKEEDLKNCLSAFFKDKPVSIACLDLQRVQSEDILFEYVFLQGDFKFELCLYTKTLFSIEELSLSICEKFKTQVLISDNTINPYIWILINETGKFSTVEQINRDDDLFLIKNPV